MSYINMIDAEDGDDACTRARSRQRVEGAGRPTGVRSEQTMSIRQEVLDPSAGCAIFRRSFVLRIEDPSQTSSRGGLQYGHGRDPKGGGRRPAADRRGPWIDDLWARADAQRRGGVSGVGVSPRRGPPCRGVRASRARPTLRDREARRDEETTCRAPARDVRDIRAREVRDVRAHRVRDVRCILRALSGKGREEVQLLRRSARGRREGARHRLRGGALQGAGRLRGPVQRAGRL